MEATDMNGFSESFYPEMQEPERQMQEPISALPDFYMNAVEPFKDRLTEAHLSLPPEVEGSSIDYEVPEPEEAHFDELVQQGFGFPDPKRPDPRPLEKNAKDESWIFEYGYATKAERATLPQQPDSRPYIIPFHFTTPALRANPLELNLARHFKLPEEMYCPECGVQVNYEGRCTSPSCPSYNEVVNEEMYDEFQEKIKQENVDVMERWSEEMRRLEGF